MRRSLLSLALPYMAPITNVRFTFVISTISSLGAMVGLIVVSTISPHNLHGCLERPRPLMSDITLTYASDDATRAFRLIQTQCNVTTTPYVRSPSTRPTATSSTINACTAQQWQTAGTSQTNSKEHSSSNQHSHDEQHSDNEQHSVIK